MTSKSIYGCAPARGTDGRYHYVYRITNLVENKHYYGKRTSPIDPRLDLGTKYFSSSTNKEFVSEQKKNPQNYKYKVVRILKTAREAILYEAKVHSVFDVARNQKFYNLAKQTPNGFDTTGVPIPELGRKRISETMKKRVAEGVVFNADHRANLSKASKGKPKSASHIENFRRSILGSKSVTGHAHPRFKYWYVTPWGIFDSPEALEPDFGMTKMKNFCIRSDRKMLPCVFANCARLQQTFDSSCVGKTYRELGFHTISPEDFPAYLKNLRESGAEFNLVVSGPPLDF